MSIFKKRRRDYHGMTYHVDAKRLKKRERSSRWRKFLNRVYTVLILGTLIWLAYFVFFSPFFMINEVELSGLTDDDSKEVMMGEINEFLDSKKYWVLDRKNYFILNQEELAQSLKEKFFLSELEISKNFPKGLDLKLKERTSTLNLCLEDRCYLVDYFGQVIARINRIDSNKNLLLVYYELEDDILATSTNFLPEDSESGFEYDSEDEEREKKLPKIVPGTTRIAKEKIRALLDLFEILNKEGRGVKIESMEIYDFDGLTKKITVNMSEGFKVFFSEENDFREQVNNLNLILDKGLKVNLENIEYIDLRFGNKIYYK